MVPFFFEKKNHYIQMGFSNLRVPEYYQTMGEHIRSSKGTTQVAVKVANSEGMFGSCHCAHCPTKFCRQPLASQKIG
jgi:hypothetical protein